MTDTNYLQNDFGLLGNSGKGPSEAQRNFFREMAARFGATVSLRRPLLRPTWQPRTRPASRSVHLLKSLMVACRAACDTPRAQPPPTRQTAELLQKIMNPQEWLSATGYTDQSIRQPCRGPQICRYRAIGRKVRCTDFRMDGPSYASARAKHAATIGLGESRAGIYGKAWRSDKGQSAGIRGLKSSRFGLL